MRADKIRGWVAPLYLILCILLGGASAPRGDGVLANAILQVLAVALILFSLWTRGSAPYGKGSGPLIAIAGVWVLCAVIYLIPLPYELWSSLPGREPIVGGFALLGLDQPSMPISLAFEASFIALMGLLPPAALFLLTLQMSQRQRRRLAAAIIGGAAAAACLGAAQIASGRESGLRPYVITNPDMAVGFFANGNHQATLLLCALALTGWLLARAVQKQRGKTGIAAPAMLILFLLVSIAIVGSLAGWGLLVPAAAGVFLMYRLATAGRIGWKWGAGTLAIFALAIAFALAGPFVEQRLAEDLGSERTSRRVIATTTLQAIGDHFPVGSGLGSFVEVYRALEDPYVPAFEYVNHAHNDYLEVALETGLPGILVILFFFIWFGLAALRAWRNSGEGGHLGRAATIAIFVVLLHSLVDYPLRTAAIGGVLAVCCAFLLPARQARREKASSTGTGGLRHAEAD